jgi:uncharacterized protein YciW
MNPLLKMILQAALTNPGVKSALAAQILVLLKAQKVLAPYEAQLAPLVVPAIELAIAKLLA